MRLEGPVWGQSVPGRKFGLVCAVVRMPDAVPMKELRRGLPVGLGPGGGAPGISPGPGGLSLCVAQGIQAGACQPTCAAEGVGKRFAAHRTRLVSDL